MGIIPAESRIDEQINKSYLSMSKFVTFIICWMMRILDINGTFYGAIETVCIRTRVTARDKRQYLLHHWVLGCGTVNVSVRRTAALRRNAGKAETIYSCSPINSQVYCCSNFKVFICFTQRWHLKVSYQKYFCLGIL